MKKTSYDRLINLPKNWKLKLWKLTFVLKQNFILAKNNDLFLNYLFFDLKSYKIHSYFWFPNTHLSYLKSLLYVASHVESIWDNRKVFIKISWQYCSFLFAWWKLLLIWRMVYVITQKNLTNAASSYCHVIFYYLNSFYTYPRVNYQELEL